MQDIRDVFICYNYQDRDRVIEISKRLQDNGVTLSIDEWDTRPGYSWRVSKAQHISSSKSAIVFIGKVIDGQQQKDIDALLTKLEEQQYPVIPVLLPGASDDALPLFLQTHLRTHPPVDFRKNDPEPFGRLLWSITGAYVARPRAVRRENILIASLGDSPVVVSAMYDLLFLREQLRIDKLIVLQPEGRDVIRAYELVREALDELKKAGKLYCHSLHFEDADSWTYACLFLKDLYALLDQAQAKDDHVYLSLAGGRKSMAALMAWVVPFFSCVQGLYHVLDPDEEHFPSEDRMHQYMTPAQQRQAMRPKLDSLKLVDIPFVKNRQISESLRSLLQAATRVDFERMEDEDAETKAFVQTIAGEGKLVVEEPAPAPSVTEVESVLIVPLGESPMVATQLYTLLVRQMRRIIRKVVLVYPQLHTNITNAADIVKDALEGEASIPCSYVCVPGQKDIDSMEACQLYQETLEKAIEDVQHDHPGCTIDLALSGGRKGMTAMTLFAAQKMGIPFVYHTLITNKRLNQQIEKETTVTKLTLPELSEEDRNDRLFLRAYEDEGSDGGFKLFRVPVFSPELPAI